MDLMLRYLKLGAEIAKYFVSDILVFGFLIISPKCSKTRPCFSDIYSREILYALSHLVIASLPRVAYQRIVVSVGGELFAQYVPRLYQYQVLTV